MSARDEPLDQRDHLCHVIGRLRLHVGRRDAKRGHVLVEGRNVALGDLARGHAFLVRAPNDLVLDIGEVPHERQAIPGEAQVARDDVEDDHHLGVTDV